MRATVSVCAASAGELSAAKSRLENATSSQQVATADPITFLFPDSLLALPPLAPSSDFPLASASCGTGSFDSGAYFAHLTSERLGRVVLQAEELPSTQTLLLDWSQRLSDGAVCVADRQGSGRGRGSNQWTSPPGCLMFSAMLTLDLPGTRVPFVQYLVSLAIVEAVQSLGKEALGGGGNEAPASALDLRIKWPNDLLSNGLKVGGVLCQSTYRQGQFRLVLGVGLNVSNAEPTTCVHAIVRQEAEKRQVALADPAEPISRERLMAEILSRVERMLRTLRDQGWGPMAPAYSRAWLHQNQRLLVQRDALEGSAPHGGQAEIPVVVQGLSEAGYLLARDEATGEAFELHPDGNSLDFFQGLVRRKVHGATS
ncbi:hypothetical protein H632_c1802p0 [Helicosporidium sp. ATCC 50920]|nr:hypothetical protein H632_c1802p0 [Helicosporidium sp. ATCC 50920]|eukprot:KDD73830.1 hypothetical protein H632_c1802p0 [Helicosporidium sp. ATCC 50920]